MQLTDVRPTDLAYFDPGDGRRIAYRYRPPGAGKPTVVFFPGDASDMEGAQAIGPVRDDAADGVVLVLSGEVATQVGKGRARMKQWEVVEVPAGHDLTIRNASEDPSVVLLVVAPPPA